MSVALRAGRGAARADPARTARGVGWIDVGALAAITLLPQVLTGRGRLNADTKAYLYLDPVDLLDRARTIWDSRVGGGTVTHQAVGYLWPMGPYYALADAVGLPDWLAQRIWVGGLQLAAGLGALALFRHLLGRSWVQLPAAALYALSPFVLGMVTSQSALLVPYAGLGWLVLLMARAVEQPRSWRWPAAFALVVTTCGSLNGTSVAFVGRGAALWVPFALAGTGRTGLRTGALVLLRTGALTLLTQVWWIVAYWVGGGYGLPVLDVTETVGVTNATSSATEVLRGLGYWTFYGVDQGGLWLEGLAEPYQTSLPLLAVTFAVPCLALAAGAFTRWRAWPYFATLIGAGTVVSVGAFPLADPSPAGELFESLSRRADLVLSLRNTQRAAALVALGLAALTAAALTALERHWTTDATLPPDVAGPRRSGRDALWRRVLGLSPGQRAQVQHATARLLPPLAALGVGLIAAGALPAQWRAGLIAERFHRPDEVPEAWQEAAEHLDQGEGRVLEIPGSAFAAHRWGHALDPISVGLTDRPVIGRELVPTGGAAGADLLAALDRSMQEGWFEPAALAPVARLLGASDVLVRNDLEYERHRTVRPSLLWALLLEREAELGRPVTFGGPYENRAAAELPMVDPIELSLDPSAPAPPQVAVFPVPRGGRDPLSTRPVDGAVVLDGDGEGIVAAAAAGLIDGTETLLLGADLTREGTDAGALTRSGARYVLTDSHRKRAMRWATLYENAGATQPAGHAVAGDEGDATIDLVEDPAPGSRTVVEWRGAERIWASAYGAPATFLPEDRPANAFDGDPRTAWRSEREPAGGNRTIGIELERPVAARQVTLVPSARYGSVAVTRALVTLDGERRFEVDLSERQARDPAGAVVELDGQPFRTLTVQVLDTVPHIGRGGFAEVAIPGVEVEEVVVLPTALLTGARDLARSPLAVVLSRLVADPADPLRDDPEPAMRRELHLPAPLDLLLSGTARLDPSAAEPRLDELLGAGPQRWPVEATSSARMRGDLDARASSVLDGDTRTAWRTPFEEVAGQWLQVELPNPLTLEELALTVVTDDHHSLPRALELSVDDGDPVRLDVPELARGELGDTTAVRLPLPRPLSGHRWRITVADVAPTRTTDWYTGQPRTLPVGVAEVELPGVPKRPGGPVDTGCREDLLRVGGVPVGIRVTGEAADRAGRLGLDVALCRSWVLPLPAGDVALETAPGQDTGLDLDRLVLRTPSWDEPATPTRGAPPVQLHATGPDHARGQVRSDGEPFWLVLDQSANPGWELAIEEGDAKVDGPHPVHAHAAGWFVDPAGSGALEVVASFRPQRFVDVALVASALAALGCLAIAIGARASGDRRPSTSVPVLTLTAWRVYRPRDATSWWAVGGAALAAGLLIDPVAAVPAGAVAFASRRWPGVLRLAPPVLVAISACMVLVEQARHDHPASFGWPAELAPAHRVAMLGVVLLAVAGLDRRRTAARQPRVPVASP